MISQSRMRQAVSVCVLIAIFTTTSMISLAGPGRVAAELTVSGKSVNGESPVVLVNGEASKSGRSVFSSSSIATPAETTATLGIGKAGRIQLDPESSASLIFDESTVEAELTSGRLTVLGSLGTVKVRTNDGKTSTLKAGDSITASGQAQAARQSGNDDNYWIWILVAAGVAAAVIIAVSQSGDDDTVSPNR